MDLMSKLGLCWRILRAKPNNCDAHAERELPSHVTDDADDQMQKLFNQQIKELVLVFGTHGHSGFSAAWASATLSKLLAFEPLGPLTGEEDEWTVLDYGDSDSGAPYAQNKRCSRVFKRHDGTAYDIDGRVFRDATGAYTSKDSRVEVTFPYTPTTVYVDVPSAA